MILLNEVEILYSRFFGIYFGITSNYNSFMYVVYFEKK